MFACSDAADAEEMIEGILDRHYYDERYLHDVGTKASEMLGKVA